MAPETRIEMRAPRKTAECSGTSRARRSVVDKPPGDLEAYRQFQKHITSPELRIPDLSAANAGGRNPAWNPPWISIEAIIIRMV